jgi:hypothetical protein
MTQIVLSRHCRQQLKAAVTDPEERENFLAALGAWIRTDLDKITAKRERWDFYLDFFCGTGKFNAITYAVALDFTPSKEVLVLSMRRVVASTPQ